MGDKKNPPRLYRLFCDAPNCYRYATHQVGFDGDLVCSKHARVLRRAAEEGFLARTLGGRDRSRPADLNLGNHGQP